MRIVLAGQGALGAALLEGARAAGHDVVGVVVDDRATGWRRLETWSDPVRRQARRERIPVVPVRRMGARAAARVAPLRPELIVVGDFGLLLRSEVLGLAPHGAINAHWSLLPRHRGPDPAAAAILAGDRRSGLTLHVIDAGVDTGDILDQEAFDVGPRESSAAIYRRAATVARRRIGPLLDGIARDGVRGRPQGEEGATSHRRLDRAALQVRWERPAAEIDRLVRAASWPAAWIAHEGRAVYLSAVEPLPRRVAAEPGRVLATDPLVVAAGEGAVRVLRAWTWRGLPLPWPLRSPRVGERIG